ncbi:hypothetical protein [Nocardioides allogilvus]|uniref:hypothetical protein n=1 Tax=Nocardioides allogilvus TaxID=2072017 RepID=UPI000D32050E|nr:hypothetical protein [Nocardioides allogilvus]
MSSLQPQQSQSSRTTARRRQRSTRLSVAVALLALSAVSVMGAVVSGSALLITVAAVLAVVLGAAATKITHSELADARVEAARDRAEQARAYTALTERRTAENMNFALDMRRKITAREEVIAGLEVALSTAQRQVADQTRKVNNEARRADLAERARVEGAETIQGLERSLSSSEERAAEAIVLVSELEAELDVLRAELDSWHAASNKRANSA